MRIFGGPRDDQGFTVMQTRDNAILMIGERRVQYINDPFFWISQTYLVKLDLYGNTIWQKLYGDSLYGNYAYSFVEDPFGNLYIPFRQTDSKLMKVDNVGNILWQRTFPSSILEFGGVKFSTDYKYLLIDCAVEDPQFIYTTGIAKIDSSGNLLWIKSYDDSLPIFSAYQGLFVIQDSYFLAGRIGFPHQGILIKTDTSGNVLWKLRRSYPNGALRLHCIAQNSGNTFIAVGDLCSNFQCSLYSFKFDGNGNIIWEKNYLTDSVRASFSIVKTLDRKFALVGNQEYGGTNIVVMDSLGNVLINKKHNLNSENLVTYSHVNIVNDSGFVITGKHKVSDTAYNDCIVVKTDKFGNTTPLGLKNLSSGIPANFNLYQNYPNPFNSSTLIKFHFAKSGKVLLIVYDILGREIATLVNQKMKAGAYEVKWEARNFSSGVYFYKLSTDDLTKTRKMILVK